MKKLLCILLAVAMIFAVVACATPDEPPPATPAPPTPAPPPPPPPEPPPPVIPSVFQWNDFAGRDPDNKPDLATNGMNIWWDNWANMRASASGDGVQINFRPGGFDPELFDDMDDYFARAADWMGNWGEAINMWALEGISYCRYLTFRMAGGEGGEENFLLLHFQPEDGPLFVARFADLVTADGGNPEITTEMQDIVIDLAASGFPGMTNRMHIRSWVQCTIFLNEIFFSDPIDQIDPDDPVGGITASPIGDIGAIARANGIFSWNNFHNRDPNNKPELAPNGMNMWWDNWVNLRVGIDGGIAEISFRPDEFDSEDYDDLDDYFARASDWMGNWGEAINMWALDGIAFCRYLTIRMAGGEGGEENKLMLHFQPEDGPSFVARFSDLVTIDGGSPEITTDMQDIVIDLQASGFPGMTNRMHIRAFMECTIFLDEIFFWGPVGIINSESPEAIFAGFTVTAIGNPADLPIRDFIEEAS